MSHYLILCIITTIDFTNQEQSVAAYRFPEKGALVFGNYLENEGFGDVLRAFEVRMLVNSIVWH